ncbi:AAA family ATPase [Agrobacterium tumefaciens]|nr:AAA family ATPase [Agrobacterium tumefaciens]TQN58202.1 AAA family ATPase [Agrobacterium tumefaciens]
MTGPRLSTLVIENFRSLRGKVVIPLDAQVILVHGTNGMGKTSVLSAIELGLTGKIRHLAEDDNGYQRFLTHLEADGGRIDLTTTTPLRADGRTTGTLVFGQNSLFTANPLLAGDDLGFFAERCYLPQATLGRLLELYDAQKTDSASPLTKFVKQILGLDPLDAIVDGLHAAGHVSRIRNLVPGYKDLELQRKGVATDLVSNQNRLSVAVDAKSTRQETVRGLLKTLLADEPAALATDLDPAMVSVLLQAERTEDETLSRLTRMRSELMGLSASWQSVPVDAATRDRAEQERLETVAMGALSHWRNATGEELRALLDEIRPFFPDLPSFDADPEALHKATLQRVVDEAKRCRSLLAAGDQASLTLAKAEATIQRSNDRVGELDRLLQASAQDVRTLANALAGIAPHVAGEICPVCDRDYSEHQSGPLSAHIATKIGTLTTEAGRLQSLATERAEETTRLDQAKREKLGVERSVLSPEERAELTNRAGNMEGYGQRLGVLSGAASDGTRLTREASDAQSVAALSRRQDDTSTSILPEIDRLVFEAGGQRVSAFSNPQDALAQTIETIDQQISAAEALISTRVRATSELGLLKNDIQLVQELETTRKELLARSKELEDAVAAVDLVREHAKDLAESADRARSKIVTSVFNNTLNKVWRDLFVRLAPSEQFVPSFKLPQSEKGSVEAVLETIHRSGKVSGSPGAMLSQGNLNTAALTLFLALHLSVPSRMPWLVLDDPVQSMDDVHIAQFAALLRTLSKGLSKQLVVAVHERALFDYLTLELSPAFPGDTLISVEISRNFEGTAVATPRVFAYSEDRAIAA